MSYGKLCQSRGAAAAANECSITKRTLCATDDQYSSVGKTQSHDAGVGDESAIVMQPVYSPLTHSVLTTAINERTSYRRD